MFDITIIGAGPAGLAAGIKASELQCKTLILAKNIADPENFSFLDKALVKNLLTQAEKQGKYLEIKKSEVLSLDKNITSFATETKRGDTYYSKATIVACGIEMVLPSIPHIESFMNRGVTTGPIHSLELFKNKNCAVYGSTENALEILLLLSKTAKRLYAINPYEDYSAGDRLKGRALSLPGVKYFKSANITNLEGKKYITSIRIRKADQTEETITLDTVYADAAIQPNDTFENTTAKTLNGLIKVNGNCETSVPGIFAAGRTTDAPITTSLAAAGHGHLAASSAIKYLLHY